MSFTDNFGHPKGFLGRLMLTAMEREHLPMAKWVFTLKNIEKCFTEVRRVLKSGGTFAIINNYGDPKIDWEKKVPCMTRYTASQVQEMMNNSGFSEVSVNEKGTLFCVKGITK